MSRPEWPRRHYFVGLKKAVFFEALFPLFVLVFVFTYYLWGWRPALMHCLYGLTASVLLMEVLFLRYPKVPFTCTFVPGKAKVHVYWLPYVIGFLISASFTMLGTAQGAGLGRGCVWI